MKLNDSFLFLSIVIAFILMLAIVTIDNYLTNQSKERILIECIKTDTCSNKMVQKLQE